MRLVLTDLVNSQIGDFIVTEFFAESGQAAVCKARHQVLPRNVALKIYGPYQNNERKTLEKAIEEAKNHAKVEHSAVVKIESPFLHSIRDESGIEKFFVFVIPMELATGGNCEDFQRFRGAISVEHIDELKRLYEGVRAVHKAGISHCDLKPRNILVFEEDSRQFMKITDFGIAGMLDPLGSAASKLTPEFAPAEQWRGARRDKNDIYSLGATTYHLLTGKKPFKIPAGAAQEVEWPKVHSTAERPDAAVSNPKCPARLALLIAKMMAVDFEIRPSMQKCIDELGTIRNEILGDSEGYVVSKELEKGLKDSHTGNSYKTGPKKKVFSQQVHRAFSRTLWIVRLRLISNARGNIESAIRTASRFFSDCFCVYETFGSNDLLLRVWSNKPRFNAFKRVIQPEEDTLDDNEVEDIFYAGFEDPIDPEGPTRTGVIGLQDDIPPYATRYGHYVVKTLSESRKLPFKAFCFVESLSTDPRAKREMWKSVLREIINGLPKELEPVLYWFSRGSTYLCMVEFSTDRFEGITRISSLIAQKADDFHGKLRTNTQLATNRFTYESDQIRL